MPEEGAGRSRISQVLCRLLVYLISESIVNYKSKTAVTISSVIGAGLAESVLYYTQFMGKKKALVLLAVIVAKAVLILRR